MLDIQFYNSIELYCVLISRLHQFPLPEGKSGPQVIDLLTKRILALGAVQSGSFIVDCEIYSNSPALGQSSNSHLRFARHREESSVVADVRIFEIAGNVSSWLYLWAVSAFSASGSLSRCQMIPVVLPYTAKWITSIFTGFFFFFLIFFFGRFAIRKFWLLCQVISIAIIRIGWQLLSGPQQLLFCLFDEAKPEMIWWKGRVRMQPFVCQISTTREGRLSAACNFPSFFLVFGFYFLFKR